MNKNSFKEISLKSIVANENRPLIFIFSPNYEDRSIAFPMDLYKKKTKRSVVYCPLCFMNDSNNDSILEGLKSENLITIMNALKLNNDSCDWLQYPQGISSNAIRSILMEKIANYMDGFDILVDVSAIPRLVIFYLCEAIWYIKQSKHILCNIMFAYTLPLKYSKIMYAQDIGLLYGLFSGMALRSNRFDEIHTIIFPSRSGHEGKLLLDDLRQIKCGEQLHTIYFPIDSDNYLDSMELMRANQMLINHTDYMQRYYCTIEDACIDLHKLLDDEMKKIETQRSISNFNKKTSLYLIAPFGKKIFLPIAYFELKFMKQKLEQDIDIEISHAKGFQYTSVYSLGRGKTEIFSIGD